MDFRRGLHQSKIQNGDRSAHAINALDSICQDIVQVLDILPAEHEKTFHGNNTFHFELHQER
ncbi:hypothetical protein D3C74_318360 [compost metagenome]